MSRKKNPESIRNREQINIRLPKELVNKLRINSALESMYISDYFKKIIETFFEKN